MYASNPGSIYRAAAYRDGEQEEDEIAAAGAGAAPGARASRRAAFLPLPIPGGLLLSPPPAGCFFKSKARPHHRKTPIIMSAQIANMPLHTPGSVCPLASQDKELISPEPFDAVWELGPKLGSGAFASVHKCFEKVRVAMGSSNCGGIGPNPPMDRSLSVLANHIHTHPPFPRRPIHRPPGHESVGGRQGLRHQDGRSHGPGAHPFQRAGRGTCHRRQRSSSVFLSKWARDGR